MVQEVSNTPRGNQRRHNIAKGHNIDTHPCYWSYEDKEVVGKVWDRVTKEKHVC